MGLGETAGSRTEKGSENRLTLYGGSGLVLIVNVGGDERGADWVHQRRCRASASSSTMSAMRRWWWFEVKVHKPIYVQKRYKRCGWPKLRTYQNRLDLNKIYDHKTVKDRSAMAA